MRRRIAYAVAILAMVACGLFISTGTAQAANGCGGTFLGGHPSGIGNMRADVYWEPSTGMNCLVAVHTGGTYGTYCQTSIKAWADSGDSDEDSGNYRYFAGPVRIYAVNSCINWEASMSTGDWRRNTRWYGD